MISFFSRSDSLLKASRKERHESIEKLISMGTIQSGYYMFLVLAILIVTPGLLLDNVSVIIGGMILAPLLIPILSLSLSLVSGSVQGVLRSVKILFLSILITIAVSGVFTLVLSRAYNVVSWIPDTISPGIYVFIAFCSGIAGAFALVKDELAPSAAGVAVAVSLLPPLCAAGIGLALGEYLLVRNSLTLFAANVVGICMAAFIVFWVLGFLNTKKEEEKVIKKKEEAE